jgi:hypothetical protein
MGAPYETAKEVRAAAAIQVAEISARVWASNQKGGAEAMEFQVQSLQAGTGREVRKGDSIPAVHRGSRHAADGAQYRGDGQDGLIPAAIAGPPPMRV